MPDKPFIKGHDDDKGTHGDDQILRQYTDIPAYDKPANTENNRLMKYVKGKHSLVCIGEHPPRFVQVLCSEAEYEDYPAPTGDAHYSIEEDIHE